MLIYFMDFLIEYLFQFYGLDWLSVVFGLCGTYLLGEQKRIGFIIIVVSLICAATVAILAHTFAFLAANIPAIYLNIRAYLKWKSMGS